MNLDWREENVADMKRQMFEGSAKECLNQEFGCHYENLMQCQTMDDRARRGAFSSHESSLPIFEADAGFGVSHYGTNMSYSGFNYSVPSNSGSSMVKLNGKYTSQYFQIGSSQDYHRGSTMLVDSDGKGMIPMENFKQLFGQVVSPEQICADNYSDKVPLQIGPLGSFLQPASADHMELNKSKAWTPDPISLWIKEDTNALSSMPLSKPRLRHEQLPNYGLQTIKSEHGHVQYREISSETQMYGSRIEHNSLKLSQLFSERLPSAEEKRYTTAQAPRRTDSTRFLQKILVLYVNFKSKLVGLEKMPQEFVHHLHLLVCKFQICECDKYHTLILHFDKCIDIKCNLCQPVRQFCYTKKISLKPISGPCPINKITSESGKLNGYVDRDLHAGNYIVQELHHLPKRMKIDNDATVDDWSLFAMMRPFSEQRGRGLVNNEDYVEKVATTAVTWNSAHNDGGSMRSTKSEGHTNSTSLNKVARSIGNLGNVYNIKLGKDETISHSEDCSSVEDMDWIKTSKGESDATFGYPSSSSDSINGLPKEGNHGKRRRSCSDALDLDNRNLGKDDTISHSKEHNLIDEQQEIGWVKVRKVESNLIFGGPSLISDDISVLPQVDDLQRTLQTSNHALNLDNIKLGKDDANSHFEELNLVGEQQEIGCVEISKEKSDVALSYESSNSDGISVFPQESPIEENFKLISQAMHKIVDGKYDFANLDNHCGIKFDGLTVSGVALTDFFKAEQIREHLHSLNQDINLNVGQELHASMSEHTVGSNTCQLCAMDTIMFTALAMCCTCCDARIKHNLTYYWTKDEAGVRYCFCTGCFKGARGGNVSCRGLSFPKTQLEKGKNTEESGEAWVQCEKCERWQHQICALYNSERDLKGKAKYTCPFCRLAEIEAKEHLPITPPSGAQDLPTTKLSDYIEQRLFKSLQREREQRAEFLGKNPEEVPGASDLKVRVVLDVNKKLRVKQQFLDILHGETYPAEFPYKSKVILLFQKVEGVDVCLFAMYVQEYDSKCGNPNKRSVYISYLDSVKYFRPEIKTVAGLALRTFVYYEILIGYLDYCKRLGFITCYIWSCPPSKDEDYILHCHPETQKRPNPNKLVQWYRKMLKKAKEENVVVEFTNFYDHFFVVPNGDTNCKITAARLPYFDGDYWSRAIDDMVQAIEKENGGESERQMKNQMTKRTMKAMGHNDLSTDATKDILVMQKLGHKILPVKEEFFVVHLQFTCTNCRKAILSGNCWSCNQCSKFHLCDRCNELELSSDLVGKTHTATSGDKHQLFKIPVNEVAADTDDKDKLYNRLFDDRHLFLKFCEENYYRFDTLRRAKHSSMMILYHLLESMTMETICSICHQNAANGWDCEICSQFHVCNACYQSEGDGCHIHKLVKQSMEAESRIKSEWMQQHRALEGVPRKKSEERASEMMLLDILEHASGCSSTSNNPCSYPKCLQIRMLFRHSKECARRIAGRCKLCRKIWEALQLHSKNCNNSDCKIPRCEDLKNHTRKMSTKSDLEQSGGVNNCQYR